MALRSGSDYIESLDDGRAVYLDGELVERVSQHPAFANQIRVIADLYDSVRSSPEEAGLWESDPATGEQVALAWQIPRSIDDLAARRRMHEFWARGSYGLMGRTPDHVSAMVAAFAGSEQVFRNGNPSWADNVVRFHERARREDPYLAYVIVPPQVDRLKPAHRQPEPFLYAGVVDERDEGVVVRGAQMIGTSAVMADAIVLACILPLRPGDEDYAISAVIPCDSPGLRIYPRRPYATVATSVFDYPLSSRFDEVDSLVVFHDVVVPWERVFVYRDVKLAGDQFHATGAHVLGNFQALVRFEVKLAFAAGLASKLADLHGIGSVPPVQAHLGGQIAAMCVTFEALVTAAVTNAVERGSIVWPNPADVYTGMALQRRLVVDLIRGLRELAGGSMIALPSSERSFLSEETAADTRRYYQSVGALGEERVKFLKLLWDFVGSEFAGRQLQYEMFYSAAQHISDVRVFECYDWQPGRELVDECLQGYALGEPLRTELSSARPGSR
jgi:4-hydroxyphenylacetate 3-monooxygenase